MKNKTIKNFWKALLCVVCIIPAILFATGSFKIQRPGGYSTMGVIIGPMVFPDMGGGSDYTPPDYSNANLSADTPYADGGLRAYKTLGIYNSCRDSGYGGNSFHYLSFARFFRLVRSDGRPIYDDDGILKCSLPGVNTWEKVDFPCYTYAVETGLPSDNGGFLWTTRQGKFKNGKLQNKFCQDNKTIKTDEVDVGQPSNGTKTIGTIIEKDGKIKYDGVNFVGIGFKGNAYWENTFWGGTGGGYDFDQTISMYFEVANRDWTNKLTTNYKVGTGIYKGQLAYYSPKEFVAIATNLNNYVKIDDVQATPKYGTSVAPYKDGHHITISNIGKTKVDIENGGENIYATYYCFIDDKLPDVSYTYHNANALDNRRAGTINTNADGSKSQTIIEGVFKDQVQVNFGYDENTESPETATYTFNGETKPFTSGTWFNNEGQYTITITDLAGNTTVSKFVIDKSAPSYNKERLETNKNYKIARWYLANIPSGYTGFGSYSFAQYDDALSFATKLEEQNKVTNFTLNNLDDFTETNRVANGNTVKLGDYWLYKSLNDENLYVYYFDRNSLLQAITKYAKKFISEPQTCRLNSSIYPNDYGNKIDDSVIENYIEINGIKGYIVNDFTFKYKDDTETYAIYYEYMGDDTVSWKQFAYGVPFSKQVTSHGLYQIKEVDYVGHETTYYVFLDVQAPLLDIKGKIYGKDKEVTRTISKADIPANSELIFYYEDFEILNVIEDDKWWVMEVKCPDNTTKRFTYLDEMPDFSELGSGIFQINIADRVGNAFTFKVALLGKAPEAKFKTINANTQLEIKINKGESYNSIQDLKIYRNGICLNSELGYDEFPNIDTNELIFINPTTLKYVFNKGGIYTVEITDNFGRMLTYEFKFEKDLPTGILVGVTHNGKTKDVVKFIYDSNKYFVIVSKNNTTFTPDGTTDNNLTTIVFLPEDDSLVNYSIQLIDKSDTENYNIYNFTIKTIKPKLNLYNVEPNGTTGSNVYANWETNDDEEYSACYTLNGITKEYKSGQVLSNEGDYTITLSDEIGNQTTVKFSIDKSIDFVIADAQGKQYKVEEIRYINFDIRLINKENLSISITKNNEDFDYEFGLMITDEGTYVVRLFDEYGNSYFFTFEIDKTPPKATLYGVEEFGKTRGSAWITSQESNLTCWYVKDNSIREEYRLGDEITAHGKYVVYISDRAKNYISFEFEIDKEISYDINTYHGGISNAGVRLIAYENLKIIMYKDGKPFDYKFEQILNDDGEYSYTITDELGNRTSSFFTIITKKKQNLKHLLQSGIEIKSVTFNDEDFEFQIVDREFYIYDEGTYHVEVLDTLAGKTYSFEITLDTTPPTLVLVGVENGGSTKNKVVMKDVSEKPCDLIVTVDGANFDYKLGDEIEKSGRFVVELIDEAGNKTVYIFERVYSLNGASVAVIAGLGALVVLLIILLIKSRHHYYADKVEETVTETVVDDDFDDGEDIVIDGDEGTDESDENGENWQIW